jgi:Rrf2 family iron-sulfur cluster assembly transcriptional regulator
MTDLALHQRMKPVSLTTISQRQGTSLSYLEQLFSALRRAGLVESTRGPGGGYALARRAEQIAVAEIILAVENMEVDDYQPLTAPQVAQLKAMTGELWVSFNARVLEYLQSVSLKDLMEQAQAQGVVTAPEPEAKTSRKNSGIGPVARPLMARLQIPNSVFALGALPLVSRR